MLCIFSLSLHTENIVDMRKEYESYSLEHSMKNVINELCTKFDVIMSGQSWMSPFRTEKEVRDWCKSNMPYRKFRNKEIETFFIKRLHSTHI